MSKIIYILSNSKKLLYIINTEEFNSANNFFKNIKLLNPELELKEVFTMNDRMLLYPVFRHEENKFIIYHGDSNSNKNYKEEKEKIPHLKIINNTGVIEFFLPLPTYSKYHLDRAIELFLSDNPNHKIVVDEVTNNKYIQNNSNFNPISNPISNTNYNQFVTLGYGLGIVVNALQQTQSLIPAPAPAPAPLRLRLESQPLMLRSRLRPEPPPSHPYSRPRLESQPLILRSRLRPEPPPSHPYSRSRLESQPLMSSSRSRPRPPSPLQSYSSSKSRPETPQPTNYFSQQNRVSPVLSTEALLALNLFNRINEFNQNNRPQLQSDQSDQSDQSVQLIETVQSVESVESVETIKFVESVETVQSDKLNLQNYSEEFLSQIFNSTKSYNPGPFLPTSPTSPPPPSPPPPSPPPYVPR